MRKRIVTNYAGETIYVTIDGDMLDAIAHDFYGKHEKNTEMMLAANGHVLEFGPVLPAGLRIKLPPRQANESPKAYRRLWE